MNLKIEHKNLEQRAYEKIKDMILFGELKPNIRLKEEEMAKQFGVSRTTIKSAFLRLKSEYLLEDSPTQGVRVKLSTLEETIEAFEIREDLEGRASRIAAKTMGLEEVERLIQGFKKFKGANYKVTDPDFARLNFDMHQKIANCYANKSISKLVISLLMQNRFYIAEISNSFKSYPFKGSIEEHLDVLMAIKSRKGAMAEKLMRKHLKNIKQAFIQYYQESLKEAGRNSDVSLINSEEIK